MVEVFGEKIICGICINFEYLEVEVEFYNFCVFGMCFGVMVDLFFEILLEGIEGFYCYCYCEFSFYELEYILQYIEEKFVFWFL